VSENIDFRNLVADIAAAHFRNRHVTPSEIPTVISQIAISLSAVGAVAVERLAEPPPRAKLNLVQIRKSITRDALISFEDNKPYKTLRRHLAARGLSPEEYRIKWGLPGDYPMAAPAYREARASLAKAGGFGGRPALNAEPASNTLPPEPASNTSPAEPPNPAAAEPVSAPVPAAAGTKQGLRGLGLQRKSPSTPSAFRPRESGHDPETSTRHKRWLAMLSETDWARIRAIARQVNHAHVPAALTDLTAPLRVRTCLVGHEARFAGEHVGTLRGGQVAVLMSERGEH
jgi:predicted transcriptional regulator